MFQTPSHKTTIRTHFAWCSANRRTIDYKILRIMFKL